VVVISFVTPQRAAFEELPRLLATPFT